MKTRVFSEIGRLKKVLVHEPGGEIDIIVPEGANDLLFEDILFGEKAKEEHRTMCEVFEKFGVEVYRIKDLLVESLKSADRSYVDALINKIKTLENLSTKLIDHLKSLSLEEIARSLIEGIPLNSEDMDDDNLYLLRPIPNLLFARDPVIVAFDKVFCSSMAEGVRQREAELLKFIFIHHQMIEYSEPLIDLNELSAAGAQLTLEGGDFLVLNESTVAIAWSKRTTLKSIQLIAEQLKKMDVENLIVAKLPHKTSFIHLDTVFTRINHHEALIYPPLFSLESENRAEILYYDLTQDQISSTRHHYIFDLLKDLGFDLKPIYCGGRSSLIDQKREQWTQGSNSVCIAPGIILTYSRNAKTIQELSENGYLCISADEVLRSSFKVNFNQKMVILLEGDELCRARGGPRCLTHPLVRE